MKLMLTNLLFSILLLFPTVGFSQEQPSRSEIIEEVARTTGLASDLIDKALDGKPKWLDKLGGVVAATQAIDKILSGKDAEVVTDFVTGQLSASAEKLILREIPASAGVLGFFSAVKIYKDSLEFIRDYVFLPGLDARVYNHYKRIRKESIVTAANGEKVHNISPSNAFGQATIGSGYWAQYDAQYQKLLKSKDYNPGLVGKRLENHLKKRLDKFWLDRMEVSYQRELLQGKKQAIIDRLWASVQHILDQLTPQATIDASLFLDPASELPSGWWWVNKGRSSWLEEPVMNTRPSGYHIWRQSFTISNATGFHLDGESWCRPKTASSSRNCTFPVVVVRIFIMVAKREISDNPTETHIESLEYHVRNNGYTRLSDKAIWNGANNQIKLDFLVGGYYATVHVAPRSTATVSLDLAKKLGRVIAQKLKQRTDENKRHSSN